MTDYAEQRVRRAQRARAASTLRVLARDHRSRRVREAVAANRHAEPDVLALLAHDESADVRLAVTQNPSTPAAVLAGLCEDPNPNVVASAMRHPNLPAEVAERFSTHPEATIRAGVASHPALSSGALQRLLDDHPQVVSEALANPQLTHEERQAWLTALAASDDAGLQAVAAQHPDTPKAALLALAADEDPWLVRCACVNLIALAERTAAASNA